MSTTRVMIEIGVPDPQPEQNRPQQVSIEDQVRHAIDLVESGYNSDVEWLLLNKLYNELCEMDKKSPRIENLVNMIEPVLAKYGYHGMPGAK